MPKKRGGRHMGVFRARSRSLNGGYRDSCLRKCVCVCVFRQDWDLIKRKDNKGRSGEVWLCFVTTSSSADR